MKKIFLFISLLGAIYAQGQTYTPVFGRWQYQFFKVDSGYRGPQDTLKSALVGSTAVIGSTLYIKLSTGFWTAITGAGGSGVWGFIAGTLSSQTDLMAKFGTKYDTTVRKLDTLYAVTDSTFGYYVNGQFRTFKARGSLLSFNGRNGAIILTFPDVVTALGYTPSDLPNVVNSLQVINNGNTNSWQTGVFSARPAPGNFGSYYTATDSLAIYFDNGILWLSISKSAVSVPSVFGRTGAVVATTGDYTPAQVGLSNVLNSLQIINTLGTPSASSDIFANRPAAGTAGRLFVSTDTKEIYRDNGSSWDKVGSGASGGVTTYAALTDVNLTSLINGQVAQYNSGTGKWVNVTPTNALVGLANVPNVDATNAANISSGTLPAARIGATSIDLTTKVTGLLPDANIASAANWNAKQPAGNYITALTTDVVAAGPGSVAATIQPNVVTNAKLAQMAANTIKGNNTGSTANASDMTVLQALVLLLGSNSGYLQANGSGALSSSTTVPTTAITGVLPVANGGTGTATPGLVNGTNVTITGTWPNQTVNSSGGSGDSGLSPVIFVNLSSVNVPLEKIVSGPKRFLYADTISTDPDAMVLQYQLTSAVNAVNQTAGSDEWDPAADTVLTFDAFGNAVFKRHSDTTDDATVTVTNTTDAHTVRSKYKVNQAFAYTWSALHGFAAGFTFSASIAPTANGTLDVGSSANNLAAVRSHNFISNGAVAMSSSGTLNRFDINPNGGLAMSFYGNKDVWIGNTTSPSFLNGFRVQRTFQADSGVTLPLIGGSFSTDSNTYHPIGISTAGATVRMSGWPGGGGSFTRQPITSGTSATGTSTTNTLRVLFNFTTTVSAYSFTMPPAPADGQIVEFAGNGTLSYPSYEITTLTILPNSGQSLSYTIALTTFQAGEFSRWEYFSSTSTWQREL